MNAARGGDTRMSRPFLFLFAAAFAIAPGFVPLARAADLKTLDQAIRVQGASGVVAGSAAPALGFGAVLQTLLALVFVIALVLACAWLARRFGWHGAAQRGGIVRTVGGVSLGGKERVAVVEIGGHWLVLGAAPGNVRLLHTLPAGGAGHPNPPDYPDAGNGGGSPAPDAPDASVAPSSPTPAAPGGSFGQRFRDALRGEVGKRLTRHGGER